MTQQPPEPTALRGPASLNAAQIRAAIPRIEARIADLEALPIDRVRCYGDPGVLAAQSAVQSTFDRMYGPGTTDYQRVQLAWRIDLTKRLPPVREGRGLRNANSQEIQQAVRHNRDRALALLKQELTILKEQLEDFVGGSPVDRVIRAYSDLDLHPEMSGLRAIFTEMVIIPMP